MEDQTRHNGATGVNQLLVSGCYDTVSRLIFNAFTRLLDNAGYMTNYSKENGVGRGYAP
jgi:hypothetical protein